MVNKQDTLSYYVIYYIINFFKLILLEYSWFTMLCLLFLLIFHWSTVTLQYCASFFCTAVNQLYIYIYPLFLDFLPNYATTEHWVEIPMLYSGFSLVIYFILCTVYMSIPIFQFIPPPSPDPHIHIFILNIYVSISALQICSSVSFF